MPKRRSVLLKWKHAELTRLLAIVADLRPPLNSERWGGVEERYNRGISGTKKWSAAQLLQKFKQVRDADPTGGGVRDQRFNLSRTE